MLNISYENYHKLVDLVKYIYDNRKYEHECKEAFSKIAEITKESYLPFGSLQIDKDDESINYLIIKEMIIQNIKELPTDIYHACLASKPNEIITLIKNFAEKLNNYLIDQIDK